MTPLRFLELKLFCIAVTTIRSIEADKYLNDCKIVLDSTCCILASLLVTKRAMRHPDII